MRTYVRRGGNMHTCLRRRTRAHTYLHHTLGTKRQKIRQKWDSKKIVKLTGHTYSWNSLTNFGYDTPEMIGNGRYVNMAKLMEKLVKPCQVNLFLVGFSHLEPLCTKLLCCASVRVSCCGTNTSVACVSVVLFERFKATKLRSDQCRRYCQNLEGNTCPHPLALYTGSLVPANFSGAVFTCAHF